jgi:hypothetical protein
VTGQRGERGAQGNQGNRGAPGAAGLSSSTRRSLVYMFLLSVALSGLGLFWINHQVHATQAAFTAAQHRDQAAQQRAGAELEEKLCDTFGRLAALKPPPGNPAANPSRAYLQNQHDTLAQLGTDLGCK